MPASQSATPDSPAVIARDAPHPSLDEILRPVREDFAKSGLSEEQLMDLGRRALEEVRGVGKGSRENKPLMEQSIERAPSREPQRPLSHDSDKDIER